QPHGGVPPLNVQSSHARLIGRRYMCREPFCCSFFFRDALGRTIPSGTTFSDFQFFIVAPSLNPYGMSALPAKADIPQSGYRVRFVPEPDLSDLSRSVNTDILLLRGIVRKLFSVGSWVMKLFAFAIAVVGSIWFLNGVTIAEAAPCLIVTLTGTMGGPPEFNGLAGPGTLVRYGDDANDCGAVKMQFDAGRGTLMRLSQLNVPPVQINAG